MTFGSSSVMGGCVSTGSVFLRGELAHRSPRALDGVDRYGAYRVALRVGRFIANAAGAGLVAVGLVPDFPAEARFRAEVLKLDLERAPGCRVVIRDSAVAVE